MQQRVGARLRAAMTHAWAPWTIGVLLVASQIVMLVMLSTVLHRRAPTAADVICAAMRLAGGGGPCYLGGGPREVYPAEFGCPARHPAVGIPGGALHVLFAVDTDEDYDRLAAAYCFIVTWQLKNVQRHVRTFITRCGDPLGENCTLTIPSGGGATLIVANARGRSPVFALPHTLLAALRRSLPHGAPLPPLFILSDEDGALLSMPEERAALAEFPLVLHQMAPRGGYAGVPDNVMFVPLGWRPGVLRHAPWPAAAARSRFCFFAGRRRNAVRDLVFAADPRCEIVDADAAPLDDASYFARLAGTEVCLVPPGYDPETYRLYECLHAGAVPVIDRSQLGFLDLYLGAPAAPHFVVVDNWTNAAVAPRLDALLDAEELALAKSAASIAWACMAARVPFQVDSALAAAWETGRYTRVGGINENGDV